MAAVKGDPTDRHHHNFFGFREDGVVENIINAEFGKQKSWVHSVAGMEETPSQREIRMLLYDMIAITLISAKLQIHVHMGADW